MAYVKQKALAAGYIVTEQPFDFVLFTELSSSFAQVSPTAKSYSNSGSTPDYAVMEYSGSGSISKRPVIPTNDIIIPPASSANTSSSGCEPSDFPPPPANAIALIQRGTCTFAQKAQNAQAAGYAAAVIFNEGQPGRTDAINGTLGGPGINIPVIGTTFALGAELWSARAQPATANLSVSARTEQKSTVNVIAETPGGRADRVVVIGAHLDSVPEGPGINDNGSGSAMILEIARQMAALGIQPVNKLRFAWWGAEESGLIGSEYHVSQLSARDIKNIALNLNFDMVGSPNFGRFVYDGDGSDTPQAGPNGSSVIEAIFNDYFTSQGLAFLPTAFDGRSDYGPFIDVGIPAGGLFTGAEDIKTAAEAALFGGTVGVAFDPCYHLPCDTFANNNDQALDEMSDAAAHAILQFAMTSSAVKGTSKANDKAVQRVPAASLPYDGSHLQK